jgi:glycosyltransferase involved in cell wall biosynthesis
VSRNHTPAVTVHVPCHDYGRYLGDALDSLQAQTCTDWEAIVIDDASTDGTRKVMRHYRDDPRFHLVHHDENLGHLATYNEGLQRARAPYFVILSADDRFHPRFLERAHDVLEARPDAMLAFTDAEIIDEHGEVLGLAATTLDPDTDWVRDVSLELMLRPFVPGGAVVAHTRSLRALGGFDQALPHTTDTFLWRRLAFRGPIAHLTGWLFQHREHDLAMHTSVPWLTLMATEEALQYEWLLDDPAVPARVLAHRGRLEATLCVHRARVAFRDRAYAAMLVQFGRAIQHDPKIWQREQPMVAFGRDYLARRTS